MSPADGVYIQSEFRSANVGDGESDGESEIDVEGEHHAKGSAKTVGVARSKGRTKSRTRGPMVVPGEPFEVTTSVQFESLEEQLHRCISRMIRQPDRHAILAWGKSTPVEFEVAHVSEPRVTEVQAHLLDLPVMRRSPCFAEPHRIDQEIAERHHLLLKPAAIEVIDTEGALERRRAARRVTAIIDEHDDGDTDVPGVPARLIPRRPRGGGRAAAAIPIVGAGA